MREFLSLPEAAALLGVSRIAVFKKVKRGQLAAIRVGRNWAVPAAALRSPSLSRLPASGGSGDLPAAAPGPGKPAAPGRRKAARPGGAGAPRHIPVFEPAPEKDSLDEMGWD